jgi:hypothetical protein
MFHWSRRYIAMVAATTIGVLIAACSGSPPVVVPPTIFGPSSSSSLQNAGQQLQNVKMADDYEALDRGMLIYTPLSNLYSDEPVELDVAVIDIGRGLQLTSAPTMYDGEAVDPYDVPTAADVVVQITCRNLTCQNLTPKNQYSQLVNPQNEGEWAWALSTQNPGTAFISIIALTYEKGSGTLLYKTPILTIPLKVMPPQ